MAATETDSLPEVDWDALSSDLRAVQRERDLKLIRSVDARLRSSGEWAS